MVLGLPRGLFKYKSVRLEARGSPRQSPTPGSRGTFPYYCVTLLCNVSEKVCYYSVGTAGTPRATGQSYH